MSEEATINPESTIPANINSAVKPIQDTLEKFLEAASVEAVYSAPIEHGESLIIPSAEIVSGLGFGMGGGVSEKDEEGNSGIGGGGGGGGRVFSRPVAVIIAGPEGVRVEPVFDATKVALAFFTTMGFMVGMAMRMRRPHRSARIEG